jgi:hypothetical protein
MSTWSISLEWVMDGALLVFGHCKQLIKTDVLRVRQIENISIECALRLRRRTKAKIERA